MFDRRLPAVSGEPKSESLCSGFATGANVEFSQHCGDMVIDRLLGYDQALCDLRVAQPLGEKRQHVELA